MLFGMTNVPIEITLTSTSRYADIFNEVDVDVVFTAPDGVSWKVPAFWAGDTTFRVRFAAPHPGVYTYKTICSNEADTGLHGQSGQYQFTEYSGVNELYRHGRLRVAPSGRHLEHADGTAFLWLGDTWWMGLSPRLPWPQGFQMLTKDRVDKGFSVIQMIAGPFADFDLTCQWTEGQANEAGWSWEKGWTHINPAYFDLADLRIAHLVEMGLVPCLLSMWGYYMRELGLERVKKHLRYIIARYGSYPLVWCAAGETGMTTYSRHGTNWNEDMPELRREWTKAIAYLRQADPFNNPITTHPVCMASSLDEVTDPSLIDVAMLQTPHSSLYSLPGALELLNRVLEANPNTPVLNGEPSYEGTWGTSWQDVQRYLFWSHMTSGAAGHTYGAQGIWGMNSKTNPAQLSTRNGLDGYWEDAMHYHGSAQLGLGRKFFLRFPWETFKPYKPADFPGFTRPYTLATGLPGSLLVCYLPMCCVPDELKGLVGQTITLSNGSWQGFFFDLRTGNDVELGLISTDSQGKWRIPDTPSNEDWVLVVRNVE